MKRVLITGAQGFVGQNLFFALRKFGYHVQGTARAVNDDNSWNPGDLVFLGDIGEGTDWSEVLDSIDVVIHLAGRAHILRETAKDPQSEFRRINVLGTKALTKAVVNAQVRRLIFISSVGVNGNLTRGIPFSEVNRPKPHNAYAVSKLEAEKTLHETAQETGLEVIILRPPLVYGPRVGANFLRLLRLVQKGIPLPLGLIENNRSLLYVGNLVDAIITCLEHPAAAGQTYLVSDGEDVSTPELIKRIANALQRPARLLPVPPAVLRFAGRLTGKSAEVERLLDSLVIDSSKIRRELDWKPPYTMEQGLAETARWFKKSV